MSFLWRRNEIKNSRIIYDHKLEDIEITLIQSDNFNNEVFYDLIPKIKHEMAEGIVEKIIELNDKYLKIKDGEGDITTYIRLSEKTEKFPEEIILMEKPDVGTEIDTKTEYR